MTAAFCLMSIIPILALLNFIFPSFLPQPSIGVILIVVIALALFGFLLMKRIVDPIIMLSSEAKVIAGGELTRKISVARNDEIGDLGLALNQLTKHIRNNMDELKIYGERTKDINLKINKQVFALNGLLQIGNLISKGVDFREVADIGVSRLLQVADSSFAFIALSKEAGFEVVAHYGLTGEAASALVQPDFVHLLRDVIKAKTTLAIDKKTSHRTTSEWLKMLGAKNVLLSPVAAHWKAMGLVGMGNQIENFEYPAEDVEIVGIFAKQLAIAVENDFLAQRVKELEIKDSLTDLYNKRYMATRLEEEVLRAISHQKPCSYIALRVVNFNELKERGGDLVADSTLVKIARCLKSLVGELDRVGRIGTEEFSIVFPEKNKRQAQELASKIEDKMRQVFGGEDPHRRPDFRIGVVENPIDGADASSLMEKVQGFLGVEEKGR